MPINPWLADRFELIRDIPSFDAALADPRYGANLAAYLEDPEPWTPPAGVAAEDEDADGVPVKLFRPPGAPTAALLWMHGGGFVMGTLDDTESVIPGYELAARATARRRHAQPARSNPSAAAGERPRCQTGTRRRRCPSTPGSPTGSS